MTNGGKNDKHILDRLGPFLDQFQYLVEFCGKKIQGSQNTTIGTQVVPFIAMIRSVIRALLHRWKLQHTVS